MNEFLSKKISKHKKTLDLRKSSIRRLGESQNLLVGEVCGIYDCSSFVFVMKGNVVTVSDLLDYKNSRIDFSYNLATNTFTGKITRERERLLSYVYIMVNNHLDGFTQRKEVN